MLSNSDLLAALVAVGRHGSIAKAANEFHFTPPAMSQRMRALERRVGVRLFEKIGRGIRLTPEAKALISDTAPALSALDEALERFLDGNRTIKGQVRIGGPGPFCRMWLRPRLHALLKKYPELEISVRFEVPSVLGRRLAAGEYDFCILASPVDAPGLTQTVVHVETFVAVASPRYLKREGALKTADEFASRRFIAFDEDLAMLAPWWRVHFGRKTPLPTRFVCHVANLDEMLALAEADFGIAVLPDFFVEDSVRKKRVRVLAPVPSPRHPAQNPLFLAWRTGAVETARLKAVHQALARV